MQLSIIIINYNTFTLTCNCIRSIHEKLTGLSYEIVLVDNASVERDPNEFKALFPDIVLVASKENTGFTGGNNLGLKHASGEYILLLNSDTELINNAPKIEPYLWHVIARNQHETGEYLHQIATPTLCLVGSEDKVDADTGNHVATSEHLRDHIKNAKFQVIDGCGHGFFWQKPEETNWIIREWLDSH